MFGLGSNANSLWKFSTSKHDMFVMMFNVYIISLYIFMLVRCLCHVKKIPNNLTCRDELIPIQTEIGFCNYWFVFSSGVDKKAIRARTGV